MEIRFTRVSVLRAVWFLFVATFEETCVAFKMEDTCNKLDLVSSLFERIVWFVSYELIKSVIFDSTCTVLKFQIQNVHQADYNGALQLSVFTF